MGRTSAGVFGRISVNRVCNPRRTSALKQKLYWLENIVVLLEQVLTGEPKVDRNISDSEGGDSISRAFFESLFIFADKDDKGELVVEDLETLFQAGDETAMKNDVSVSTNSLLMSHLVK